MTVLLQGISLQGLYSKLNLVTLLQIARASEMQGDLVPCLCKNEQHRSLFLLCSIIWLKLFKV